MATASADERVDAIVAHLLADLDSEARRAWELAPAIERLDPQGLHETLHSRLGGISRTLRATKAGLPIHAACCTLIDGRGLLIAGPTESGKSTLAALLGINYGATLVSDDTVWVADDHASSIGAPLALRPGSPVWDRARRVWYAEAGHRLLARPGDLGIAAAKLSGPLKLILLPRYGPSPAGLRAITPAETFCHLAASLLRGCSPAELDSLAQIATRLSAASISYSDAATSLELCINFFDATPEPARVEPSRIAEDDLQESGLCKGVEGIRFGREVALWRSPSGQLIYLRDWVGGSLCKTPASEQLATMGLLERGEHQR